MEDNTSTLLGRLTDEEISSKFQLKAMIKRHNIQTGPRFHHVWLHRDISPAVRRVTVSPDTSKLFFSKKRPPKSLSLQEVPLRLTASQDSFPETPFFAEETNMRLGRMMNHDGR